jgi:hypothetical protein
MADFAALPSNVLAQVLSALSVRDTLRFCSVSRTTSRQAVFGEFWEDLGRAQLSRFLPARFFFDGPSNDSLNMFSGRLPRARFYDAAAAADEVEKDIIHKLEAAGAAVTWNCKIVKSARKTLAVKRKFETNYSVACLPCSVVGPPTSANYRELFAALRCRACSTDIAARQCASCSSPICLTCATRCDWDLALSCPADLWADNVDINCCELVNCAFALCPACIDEHAILDSEGEPAPHRDLVLELESTGPYLSRPICNDCKPVHHVFCPAHVDLCILACSGCDYSYCLENGHTYQGFPMIDLCGNCNQGTCINQARTKSCELLAGFSMNWCNACARGCCSVCSDDFTSACPTCGETAGYSFH